MFVVVEKWKILDELGNPEDCLEIGVIAQNWRAVRRILRSIKNDPDQEVVRIEKRSKRWHQAYGPAMLKKIRKYLRGEA